MSQHEDEAGEGSYRRAMARNAHERSKQGNALNQSSPVPLLLRLTSPHWAADALHVSPVTRVASRHFPFDIHGTNYDEATFTRAEWTTAN